MKPKFQLMKRLSSIERFLLIVISLLFTAYVGASYLLGSYQTKHEMNEIFDPQLTHSAFLLFDLLGESVVNIDQKSAHLPIIYHNFQGKKGGRDTSHSQQPEDTDFIYANKFAYQVFNSEGKLLIKSNSAPDVTLSNKVIGFSSTTINEEQWRVYSLHDKALDFWLYVAEDESLRDEISAEISAQIPLPALIISPLFFILVIISIRMALTPLKLLVASINKRDIQSLEKIELDFVPKEIKPVVEAINSLISRLENALTREKRLTADTAHELRTPLSVVLIHAQNALNNHSDKDRTNALKELENGVKRVARLLEQLLTLSKINPDTMPKSAINVYQLTQQTIAEMAIKIIQKNQEISLHCEQKTQTISCQGNQFLLEILLRNLIDNASQYTPHNGDIKIFITHDNQQITITVEDSGIGVEPEFYTKITERFYRKDQQQGKGAGLGLTLVNNIIEYHSGSLNFDKSQLGGLSAKVNLSTSNPSKQQHLKDE